MQPAEPRQMRLLSASSTARRGHPRMLLPAGAEAFPAGGDRYQRITAVPACIAVGFGRRERGGVRWTSVHEAALGSLRLKPWRARAALCSLRSLAVARQLALSRVSHLPGSPSPCATVAPFPRFAPPGASLCMSKGSPLCAGSGIDRATCPPARTDAPAAGALPGYGSKGPGTPQKGLCRTQAVSRRVKGRRSRSDASAPLTRRGAQSPSWSCDRGIPITFSRSGPPC